MLVANGAGSSSSRNGTNGHHQQQQQRANGNTSSRPAAAAAAPVESNGNGTTGNHVDEHDEFDDEFGMDLDEGVDSLLQDVEATFSATQANRSHVTSAGHAGKGQQVVQPPSRNDVRTSNGTSAAPAGAPAAGANKRPRLSSHEDVSAGRRPGAPSAAAGPSGAGAGARAPVVQQQQQQQQQQPAPVASTSKLPRRRIPRASAAPEDEEQMPEISIGADGSYAIRREDKSSSSVNGASHMQQQQAPVRPQPQQQQQQQGASAAAEGSSTGGKKPALPRRLVRDQDQAIVVQHPGTARRPGLPEVDVFEGDNDQFWNDASALDQLEEQAISMSQQVRLSQQHPQQQQQQKAPAAAAAQPNFQQHQRQTSRNGSAHLTAGAQRGANGQRATSPAGRAGSNGPEEHCARANGSTSVSAASDAAKWKVQQNQLEALKRQVAALTREREQQRQQQLQLQQQQQQAQPRAEQATAQAEAEKKEAYKERGENLMLRSRLQKGEAEIAQLHRRVREMEEAHKQELLAVQKQSEENLRQSRTVDAFARIERETTRWPGAAARTTTAGGGAVTPSRTGRGGVGAGAGSAFRTPASRRGVRAQEDAEPESPSRRAAAAASKAKATPVKEFDGFQNAFMGESIEDAKRRRIKPHTPSKPTTPRSASKREALASARRESQSQLALREDEDDLGAGDLPPLDDYEPPQTGDAAAPPPGRTSSRLDAASDLRMNPRTNYVWAVSALTSLRDRFIGFLLAHQSLPHTHNSNIPLTIYHTQIRRIFDSPSALSDASIAHCPYPTRADPPQASTIMRVLNAALPPGVDHAVQVYHATALDLLMQRLVHDSVDAEEHFRQWAAREAYASAEEVDEELELLHRFIHQDGFLDLANELSVPIRMLFAIFLRLCMMDAFNDLIELCADACAAFPRFATALFHPTRPLPTLKLPQDVSQDFSHLSDSQQTPFVLPSDLHDLLFEAILKTWGVRVELSAKEAQWRQISSLTDVLVSPYDAASDEETLASKAPHWSHPDAQAARRGEQARMNAALLGKCEDIKGHAWRMGEVIVEETYQSVIGLMRALARECIEQKQTFLLESLISQPGLVTAFLHADRAPANLVSSLQLLCDLSPIDHVWEKMVACKAHPAQKGVPLSLQKSQTPLLEILAKHLVDRRVDFQEQDAHDVHIEIIKLWTLLATKHREAKIVIGCSKHVLAALISCIHADTTVLWSTASVKTSDQLQTLLLRLSLDINLMRLLYQEGDEPQDLCARLENSQTQAVLNGVKHSFILALSRVAFAEEPEWITALHSKATERRMEHMAEMALGLLELVLSPEELDEVWQMLAGGDEDEDDEQQAGDSADNAMIID